MTSKAKDINKGNISQCAGHCTWIGLFANGLQMQNKKGVKITLTP